MYIKTSFLQEFHLQKFIQNFLPVVWPKFLKGFKVSRGWLSVGQNFWSSLSFALSCAAASLASLSAFWHFFRWWKKGPRKVAVLKQGSLKPMALWGEKSIKIIQPPPTHTHTKKKKKVYILFYLITVESTAKIRFLWWQHQHHIQWFIFHSYILAEKLTGAASLPRPSTWTVLCCAGLDHFPVLFLDPAHSILIRHLRPAKRYQKGLIAMSLWSLVADKWSVTAGWLLLLLLLLWWWSWWWWWWWWWWWKWPLSSSLWMWSPSPSLFCSLPFLLPHAPCTVWMPPKLAQESCKSFTAWSSMVNHCFFESFWQFWILQMDQGWWQCHTMSTCNLI